MTDYEYTSHTHPKHCNKWHTIDKAMSWAILYNKCVWLKSPSRQHWIFQSLRHGYQVCLWVFGVVFLYLAFRRKKQWSAPSINGTIYLLNVRMQNLPFSGIRLFFFVGKSLQKVKMGISDSPVRDLSPMTAVILHICICRAMDLKHSRLGFFTDISFALVSPRVWNMLPSLWHSLDTGNCTRFRYLLENTLIWLRLRQ